MKIGYAPERAAQAVEPPDYEPVQSSWAARWLSAGPAVADCNHHKRLSNVMKHSFWAPKNWSWTNETLPPSQIPEIMGLSVFDPRSPGEGDV